MITRHTDYKLHVQGVSNVDVFVNTQATPNY